MKYIISLIIIILLLFYYWPSIILPFIYNKENVPLLEAFRNIATISTSIISFLNLLLIFHFFFKDKEIKNDERKIINKNDYFKRLFIERNNTDKIYGYFESAIKIIDDSILLKAQKNETKASDYEQSVKNLIQNYINNKKEFGESFIDSLQPFDERFSQYLYEMLDSFEDEFTEKLATVLFMGDFDKNELMKIIRNQKSLFLKTLYEYGINDCIYHPKKTLIRQ